MPPYFSTLVSRASFQPDTASNQFSSQWKSPGDVFSVLLILGGDVVARSLAQSTGRLIGAPSFSFGWVAYSINALVSAMGENKLMPLPDCSCIVLNGKTGYSRDNTSWILGRLVRDYEGWADPKVHSMVQDMIRGKWEELKAEARKEHLPEPPAPAQAGLCVSIYKANPKGKIGVPADNMLNFASVLVAFVQLGVAAIPFGIFGDYSIFMITIIGIILSSATASLPQWKMEKWACRLLSASQRSADKKVILTRGNGSQHAIVILGCEGFLDLEDLAGGQTNVDVSASRATRIAVMLLAFLWVLLLISAAGVKENTWFLMAVGGIGIFLNIYVAGHGRHPRDNGLPIEFAGVVGKPKVMEALYELEAKYPRLGSSMVDVFFPGKLRADEQRTWDDFARTARDREAQRVAGTVVPGAAAI